MKNLLLFGILIFVKLCLIFIIKNIDQWFLFLYFVPTFFILENTKVKFATIFFGCEQLIWSSSHLFWLSETFYPNGLYGFLAFSTLYSLFGFLVVQFIHKRTNYISLRFFIFVLCWITFEWLMLHLRIGFPWITLGHFLAEGIWAIQWYEYTGVLGGSLWILMVNSFVSLILIRFKWIHCAYLLIAISGPLGISLTILQKDKTRTSRHKKILCTQPNWSERDKRRLPIKSYIENLPVDSTVDLILLPEVASSQVTRLSGMKLISNDHESIRQFCEEFPNTTIAFGSRIINQHFKESAMVNGIIFTSHTDEDFTSKGKLIPFWETEIMGLSLAPSHLTFISIEQKNNIQIHNTSYLVLTCYDALFGEYCADALTNETSMILMFSEEGFMSETSGLHQYLQISRLRAIESRLHVIRSSNKGLSCFIDPWGKIEYVNKDLSIGHRIFDVPIRENSELTFYAQYGDWIGEIAIMLVLVAIGLVFLPSKKIPKANIFSS